MKACILCSWRNRHASPKGYTMKSLMNKDEREIKKNKIGGNKLKIDEYRKRISDESYLDHAINKIATDLSHYLTK